jgi:phospholipid transport system substrate-binding protein
MKTSLNPARLFATACLALLTSVAAAQSATESPDEMIKRVSNDVLKQVQSNQSIKDGNVAEMQKLVDQKILPYTDFDRMTASAVGRSWSKATPEQQKQLVDGFKTLLIKTYSGAMSSTSDAKLVFRPTKVDANATDAVVRSQVLQSGSDPIQLDYRVNKTDGGWKINDVNVVGVWLVENYRTQFQSEITNNGIDGLIASLNAKR